MSNTTNQKIPCGGFRIGDGLTMDGDTLKSLGGAYVKVDIKYGEATVITFAEDSPLKSFKAIEEAMFTCPLFALVYDISDENIPTFKGVYAPDSYKHIPDTTISFSKMSMQQVSDKIHIVKNGISITFDNEITEEDPILATISAA